MCADPITAMVVAGAAIKAGGQIVGGISANATAKANARALDEQARLRELKGEYDAEAADRQFRRERGKSIAAIGASGITAESFLDVLMDDAAESALEKEAIKFGAMADARNLRQQGRIVRKQGQAALIGSVFSAAGTVASGAASYNQATGSGWATSVNYGAT